MKHIFVSLSLLAVLSGCASIIKGGAEDIAINSNVADSKFEIRNNRTNATQLTGQTPSTVKLDRGAGYFKGASYTVTISKEGYTPQNYVLESSMNGWYLGGNLLVGGLIGYLIVDPATGAMWTLNPDGVNAQLAALAPAATPVAQVSPPPVPAAAAASPQPPAMPVAQPVDAPIPPSPAPPTEPAAAGVMTPAQQVASVSPTVSIPAAVATPVVPPALAISGHAKLRDAAFGRNRATLDGAAVAGLGAGTSVKLKSTMENSTGTWWYVVAPTASGWARAQDLEAQP